MHTKLIETMFNTLDALTGTWYVHYTNFPMWLKGDKKEPSFHYRIVAGTEGPELEDTVFYMKGLEQKRIRGWDKPINKECTKFEWRGKGLLTLVRSKWEWVHMDDDFALIFFERTLFTPKGYDIICREKVLSPEVHEAIVRFLDEQDIWGMQRIR
ncbi:hypothetical protein [Edaphocola aurantiacus]|uniref:hypothetical protein n=1 Tax=Edaphocola aurantiacus TaxID=2601682 RepID=UPI001C956CD2|nr:hypothetical protein [Edaphocola aurantiacus]